MLLNKPSHKGRGMRDEGAQVRQSGDQRADSRDKVNGIFYRAADSWRLTLFLLLILKSTGQATTSINSDSSLTLGASVTGSGAATPLVTEKSNSSITLWQLLPNPWGVSSGTGNTTISYTGAGALTISVNYSGLNNSGVNGYPSIWYGGDEYGSSPINTQGLTFPSQLSSMSSLIFDVNYSLAITTKPGNQDIGYDEWLIPSPTYSGGQGGALEVVIAPYYVFSGGGCRDTTFTATITLNGSPNTSTWHECSWGTGPGNEIIFYPSTPISSGDVRLDAITFFSKAIADYGGGAINSNWYVAGVFFGSEYGGTSNVNYTLTTTKVDIEQTIGSAGTAPVITSPTTATTTVGTSFSYQIAATNSPTSYNATGLPAGLSVNTNTGVISGTSTASGVFTSTISATNAFGTGSGTLVLTINPAPGCGILGQIFRADNPWNTDISTWPVHPNSANYVNSIGGSGSLHPDFGTVYPPGSGIPWGIP